MASQLWRLEAAIRQIQLSPNANPALLAQLPQMQQRADELAIAVDADRILTRLGNQIVSKEQERVRRAEHNARKAVEKETRDMVAESMLRQGSGKLPGPEPAPSFGQMSESEFKRHTRENYGF
jgi:hypothetical protein